MSLAPLPALLALFLATPLAWGQTSMSVEVPVRIEIGGAGRVEPAVVDLVFSGAGPEVVTVRYSVRSGALTVRADGADVRLRPAEAATGRAEVVVPMGETGVLAAAADGTGTLTLFVWPLTAGPGGEVRLSFAVE